ncbi:thiamine pyrophosphate-binding protein [Glycocaulis sp.]|uniref:thiamine pyrophosphate-binding protein n=1 Tax=Glycocaulis sp. TaxID=1969725 RepID=UPI0025BFBD6C|nr:thiamine pyrophosphate-binding protein [Glycocaulis sp.]MCH8521266.1 thiamine pyrophosphate-binding protein [Glycocaulis sp.]
MPRQTGAEHLADALIANGAHMAFGVPGESYLALLDAIYEKGKDFRFITCRQEAGAANMAEAHGKLTGRPGICMVTRGPGATQASVGVHTAFQDSTPMILLIGQVARDMKDREAFQEVDYTHFFRDQCKWVAEIHDPARVPEYMARAFATAMNGRPGPVVLSLPEDMLTEIADAPAIRRVETAQAAPALGDIAKLEALLVRAKRPFVIFGGTKWSEETVEKARAFAENNALPVACSFRSKDHYNNMGPNYAGDLGVGPNPKLVERVKGADLLIVFGPRLGEMTTSGYTIFKPPVLEGQTLVHIHPGAQELGRVYQADLAINATVAAAADALSQIKVDSSAWTGEAAAAHEEFLAFSSVVEVKRGFNLSKMFCWLSENLPENAILTNGAGNYAAWLHRFYRHKQCRTQLGPTSGAMGYGVPAGIAAKLEKPDALVVSVNGDGCFLMCGQELATAAQYGANVIFIVADNSAYGTIRMHQERDYPGRVSGTELKNPDFAAYARSFGCEGIRVESFDDFPAAFEQAKTCGRPALLHLICDVEEIAPGRTISGLRAAAK